MASFENLGTAGAYDNLIADTKVVTALTEVVTAATDMTRGTLATVADGKATKATAEAGDNYVVITDDVKANGKVTAYKSGNFIRQTVEAATGIELTAAVEEAARKDNISFVDAN